MKKLLLFAGLFFALAANAQLRLVANFDGTNSGNVKPYLVHEGKLYFTANTPATLFYSTQGSTSNTLFEASLGALARPSATLVKHVVFNNELHFIATYIGGSTSTQLTKSISSSNNCDAYANLSVYTGSTASQINYATVLNSEFLFAPSVADASNPRGVELYKSNGSTISLVRDIRVDQPSSNPRDLTVLGNSCFFSADDGSDRELWISDGTTAGTIQYLDINTTTSTSSSDPDNLNVLGAQLTFVATHTTLGRELFKTNGAGSLVLVKDINTAGDSNPTNITNIGGELYFSASNGTVGQELWKSNGTNLGTIMLKDINPTGDSNASKFTQMGSTVFFIANDGTNGVELWKTDGTGVGTVLVKNINPSGNSNPDYLTVYNGKLYFTADNGTNGTELWVSDGTLVGTTMIEVNPTATSNISHLLVLNNELFFAADAGTVGKELYAYMDPALSTNSFSLDKNAISLYPNPSKNYFELSGDASIQKVEVYSIQGQLVKSFKNENQYAISDLAKGIYIVKINATEGTLNKTLIVE